MTDASNVRLCDVVVGRAVLSTISDAIIAADSGGIIAFWNPGAVRIFGFTDKEAIGRSLDLIIPERLRQRHWGRLSSHHEDR